MPTTHFQGPQSGKCNWDRSGSSDSMHMSTALPQRETRWTLPKIHSQGMHIQTNRTPRLTVHLNSQGKIFGMNVALTLSYWCRGKPNLFLIAKPNGLCMGSAMLVWTCCFYSPLPPPQTRDEACQHCVWAWSHLKWEALQGFFEGGVVDVNLSGMSPWVDQSAYLLPLANYGEGW